MAKLIEFLARRTCGWWKPTTLASGVPKIAYWDCRFTGQMPLWVRLTFYAAIHPIRTRRRFLAARSGYRAYVGKPDAGSFWFIASLTQLNG